MLYFCTHVCSSISTLRQDRLKATLARIGWKPLWPEQAGSHFGHDSALDMGNGNESLAQCDTGQTPAVCEAAT